MGRSSDWWLEEQQAQEDDSDYWEFLKTYLPAEPAGRFDHSIQMVDELMNDAGKLSLYPMFQRMVFVQLIVTLEAYLSDRLISVINKVESVRFAFIKGSELRSRVFSMEAFVGNPDLIIEKTNEFLKKTSFHNMETVEKFYRAAFGVSPFPSDACKAFLEQAEINRHHCVHRDGKDSDGHALAIVDYDYNYMVKSNVVAMVNHIERAFAAQISLLHEELGPRD